MASPASETLLCLGRGSWKFMIILRNDSGVHHRTTWLPGMSDIWSDLPLDIPRCEREDSSDTCSGAPRKAPKRRNFSPYPLRISSRGFDCGVFGPKRFRGHSLTWPSNPQERRNFSPHPLQTPSRNSIVALLHEVSYGWFYGIYGLTFCCASVNVLVKD